MRIWPRRSSRFIHIFNDQFRLLCLFSADVVHGGYLDEEFFEDVAGVGLVGEEGPLILHAS